MKLLKSLWQKCSGIRFSIANSLYKLELANGSEDVIWRDEEGDVVVRGNFTDRKEQI